MNFKKAIFNYRYFLLFYKQKEILMKITNNFVGNIENYSTKDNKPSNQINFTGDNSKDNIIISDSEMLRAHFGVNSPSDIKYQIIKDKRDGSLAIQSIVKLQAGDLLVLKIDEDTINELLRGKDGKINDGYVKKFISIFKQTAENLARQNEADLEFYDSKMHEESNTITFDPKAVCLEELANMSPDGDFARNVVSRLDGKFKQGLARALYTFSCEDRMRLSSKACHFAEEVFGLSKTDDGYDFSEIARKTNIVKKADYVGEEYGKSDVLDLIKHYAKTTSGSYDIDYIEDMLDLMSSFQVYVPVSKVAETVGKYCSDSSKNHDAILETMIKLQKSDYPLSDDDNDFDTIMSFCFDKEGNFSQERAQYLIGLTDAINEYIDSEMEDFADYPAYLTIGKNAITEYFALSIGEDGSFKPSLDVNEYIDKKMQG